MDEISLKEALRNLKYWQGLVDHLKKQETQSLPIGTHHKEGVKLTGRLSYAVASNVPKGAPALTWRPSLSLTEYRKLSSVDKEALDKYLTSKVYWSVEVEDEEQSNEG